MSHPPLVAPIRPATVADAAMLARHRALMFRDMGSLPELLFEPLVEAAIRYFESAVPAGEYRGWVATNPGRPEEVVAGAGLELRRILPRPAGRRALIDRQGLVLNVYTEPAWRRRGLARRLMEELLAWARTNGLESLVLHASDEGRGLYQKLGFRPTNEMGLSLR